VKALITKVWYQAFKLIDSAMALFDKHDSNVITNSKLKDNKNAHPCYKEQQNSK
jgi:hypothetical protein